MVVRNPFDAILSYWHFWKIGWPNVVNTKNVDMKNYNTTAFRNFVQDQIYRWYELIEDWINFGTDIHFVFYEELKENPIGETRRLMKYFGLGYHYYR